MIKPQNLNRILKHLLILQVLLVLFVSCNKNKNGDYLSLPKKNIKASGFDRYGNYFFVDKKWGLIFTQAGDEVVEMDDKFAITLDKNPIKIERDATMWINKSQDGLYTFSMQDGNIIKSRPTDKIIQDDEKFLITREKQKKFRISLDSRRIDAKDFNNDHRLLIDNIKAVSQPKTFYGNAGGEYIKVVYRNGDIEYPASLQISPKSIKYRGRILSKSGNDRIFFITDFNDYCESNSVDAIAIKDFKSTQLATQTTGGALK